LSDVRLAALGVHRIAVPVPFAAAGGPANVYAFEEPGGGVALFDAGIKSPEGEQALRAGLAAWGKSFRDVSRILVSHGHIDHFGLARLIQSESGCPVYVHPLDQAKVRDATRRFRSAPHYAEYLGRLGLSGEQIELIREGGDHTQAFADGLDEVRDLAGGERLQFAKCAVEVLHLPGHTPGLVCLWDEAHRVLYADDHLLQKVSPNPLLELGPHGESDKFRALVTYLESARRAQRLPAELICPGHGEPFAGHGPLIDDLLAFYARRQERLVALLQSGERSALELVALIFGRVRRSQLYLQLSEVVGNLEVLEEQGRVQRRFEGGVYRYSARAPGA
jgi:glyoxylase-like metal-dependent hydrolase (beta-lactamase superfamily II)